MTAAVVSPEARLRAGGTDTIVATARAVGADLATRAAEVDRDAGFPARNVAALWAAGLGNLTLPTELGGVGAGLETTARVVDAIGGGDASTALILVMHLNQLALLTDPESPWPEHLRRRVIESSLDGPALINVLHVEPDLGTPSRGGVPATRALRAELDDGIPVWRLTGHKIYSTGSSGLRWMLVSAATENDPDGQRVGSFLVPGQSPGVEIRETWDHLGMRATVSHDVLFHEVTLPLDHVAALRLPGGPPSLRDTRRANVLIAALYLGVARAARDWLVRYLNERAPANLGAPLASLPRFQSEVGEIEAELYEAEQLTYGMAARFDTEGGTPEVDAATPLVKMVVARLAIEAVERGLRLIGNPGLSRSNPLERHYRDVLCSRIHWPQDDAVLLRAGRSALERGRP
jgi:alkylation response protein AidB-like acyl-CoA dehydrogenase